MKLLGELRRRNVIRMAGLYLVGAWLLVQVAGTVLPWFNVPATMLRGLVLLLALGFVPALVFAWVFELTPEGIKRDAEVDPAQSIAPQTARRMDRIIIAVLCLALVFFAFDRFVLAPKRQAEAVAAGSRAHQPAAAVAPAQAGIAKRSIAVLPFVNMSTDKENEFFSDGLSEEILNSLARIDGLQVVGRTSSFQFKGKNTDLRTIGEALGVATVLEGSVRREGERARITAQLIRASDGIHLWSRTYDRTVQDTLAVQLDIAEQVAGALNVLLDDAQRKHMRKARVKDVDAFIAYQKGLKLYDEAHTDLKRDLLAGLRQANAEFDRATALEPGFSEAHFAKADLYEHSLQASPSLAKSLEAQSAALRTLELAANSSHDEQQRLLTLAERQMLSDDWRGLSTLVESAFKVPGCNSSNWLPVFASAFGYGDAIEDFGQRASACDPLNRINYSTRVTAALANGQGQRALDVLAAARKATGQESRNPGVGAAVALLLLGRADEAARTLDGVGTEQRNEAYFRARVVLARVRGEDPAAVQASVRGLDRSHSKFAQWPEADAIEAEHAGDRAAANRFAAALDARPAGPFLLAIFIVDCHCGAPFDLEATPNFKARLAESGLRWPPPATIAFPPRK